MAEMTKQQRTGLLGKAMIDDQGRPVPLLQHRELPPIMTGVVIDEPASDVDPEALSALAARPTSHAPRPTTP